MAKKRVYEIVKELKAEGIELDGKELVKELNEIGFSIKSSSSSLDEEDATSAIKKIIQKRKGVQPVKAAGFVVRRRAPSGGASHGASSNSSGSKAKAVAPAVVRSGQRPSEKAVSPVVRKAEPKVVEKVAEQVSVKPVVAPKETVAASVAGQTVEAVSAVAVETTEVKSAEVAQIVVSENVASEAQKVQPVLKESVKTPSEQVTVSAPETVQETKKAEGENVATVEPPSSSKVSEKREMKTSEVATGNASLENSASATVAPVSTPPKPASVDPKTLHPTANQAVVISRPLIPIRRVTPPSDAARRVPQAPGPRALVNSPTKPGSGAPGARTFSTPDALSGRRNHDAGRDQQGKRRSGARQNMKESYSKQELLDLARGRTAVTPARIGKKKKSAKDINRPKMTQMSEEKKVVKIDESINVADLSQKMGVKAVELMRKLIGLGMMVTINSPLDVDTATLLASDYGWRVEKTGFEIEDYITDVPNDPEDLVSRPPVVTIMGHVDHGKTSLLDAIRNARVAAGEAGGITQHIGAYSVETEDGRKVTFLDTPGHEAFTAMRARGAKVTDLVVIVVAADDGVMPQTREAINHAKAANVPILVAINKIDKPGADPQRVKNQLMEFGLVDESLGGETIMVPVSAKTKLGLDNLLEMILLQSEVLDLKANPDRKAHGTVVEAKLEKGRGAVATVIVSEGTLRTGDALVSGNRFGRIRAMQNDRGEKVTEVLPGFPVEIIGLDGVPTAGDDFDVVESESAAKEIASHRIEKERMKELATSAKVRLEDLFAKAEEGVLKELHLVVKADVQGSAEAVSQSLSKLATKKVGVKIIHSGVGGINGNDVMLAAASDAIIIGFNVRPELKASELAAQQGVDVRLYSIIYEAVDEVQKAMEGLLEPTKKEKVLGRAEVRNTFTVPKVGTIAGCFVNDGKVTRSAQVRLLRDSKVIYTGKVASLRRFKDDVKEVEKGYECGLSIENFSDIKQGDAIEAFEIEIIRPSLD